MNRTRKKLLTLLLAALMILGMLTGCGGEDNGKTTDSTTSSKVTDPETEETEDSVETDVGMDLEFTIWYNDEAGILLQFFSENDAVMSNVAGGEEQEAIFYWNGEQGSMEIEDWTADLMLDGKHLVMMTDGRVDYMTQLEELPDSYIHQSSNTDPDVDFEALIEETIWYGGNYTYIFFPDGECQLCSVEDDFQCTYEVYTDGSGHIFKDDEMIGFLIDENGDLTVDDESITPIQGSRENYDSIAQIGAGGILDDGREPAEALIGTCWNYENLYYAFLTEDTFVACNVDTGENAEGEYCLNDDMTGQISIENEEGEFELRDDRLCFLNGSEEIYPDPVDYDTFLDLFGETSDQ